MGGRGGYSNHTTSKKILNSIENTIKSMDWWQDTERYTPNPEKLKNSPSFVSSVKEEISKQAFMRDYEIKIREVDNLTDKLLNYLKKKAR